MKLPLAALTCGLLLGCAPLVFVKPGATQADYNKDSYECERDMRQSAYFGGGIPGAMAARDFQTRCMFARGYSLQDSAAPKAAASTTYIEAPPVTQRKTVGTLNNSTVVPVHQLDIDKVDELKPGVSTIGNAVDIFGIPSAETSLDDKTRLLQWMTPIPHAAQLAILFDSSGKMIRVTHRSNY